MYGAIHSRAQQLRAAEQQSRLKSTSTVIPPPPVVQADKKEMSQEDDSRVPVLAGAGEAAGTCTVEGQPVNEMEEGGAKLGKRPIDWQDSGAIAEKKQKMYVEQKRGGYQTPGTGGEDSNDSSALDPETEASNEGFASSPTIQSSSSDA
jgi:hypothetical protein